MPKTGGHKPLKSTFNSKAEKLPRENAFYFFSSIGNYIGERASSLEEFMEKIREVNVKSLEFHLYREDFEKWISGTLKDKELAADIQKLRGSNPIGDELRDQLYLIVSKKKKISQSNEPLARINQFFHKQ